MANEMPALPAPVQWEKLETFTNVAGQNVPLGGGGAKQEITATLSLKLRLYSYRTDNNPGTIKQKFLQVSLEGSRVAPNTPRPASEYQRGFFTESVEVGMGFDDSRGIELRQKAPQTSSTTGSVSSSISKSFSGGFFGETGTGNVGYSISDSFAISIPDFEFLDRDEVPNRLHHIMNLKLLSGAPYVNPTSLIDRRDSTGKLFDLPSLAIANLPLPSLALFHAPNGLNEPRTFRIKINHRLLKVQSSHLVTEEAAKIVNPLLGWAVEKLGGLIGGGAGKKPAPVGIIQTRPPYDDTKRDLPQNVGVGRINLDIKPMICPSEWRFSIPFDKV